MAQVVTATFENGILKPDQPLQFEPGARVRLIIDPVGGPAPLPPEEVSRALEELDRLCEEFPIDSGGDLLTRDQLHERH